MCGPLVAASAVLAAGSMLANKIGSDQQSAERSRVQQAETDRQSSYQNESTNLFNQTVHKIEKPTVDAAVDKEAADRTASDSKLIDEGGNYAPVTGSAPAEVGSSIARATKAALDRNKQQAKLNARVGAVAGTNFKTGIALGRDAQQQSQIGDRMQRSAAILPAELADANRAGSGARGIGQLLSAASSATGMAGLSSANPTTWGDLFSTGNPISDKVAGPRAPGLFTRMGVWG